MMLDKIWCNHCQKYMDQTSAGCPICGEINFNYKFSSATAADKKEDYLDPVEDYTDFTEPA